MISETRLSHNRLDKATKDVFFFPFSQKLLDFGTDPACMLPYRDAAELVESCSLSTLKSKLLDCLAN